MPNLPLFVYGTLTSDAAQSPLLGSLPRQKAFVRGTLWQLPAGYPALTLVGQTEVYGELVDPPGTSLLTLLDHYEGVDEGLYERRQVNVTLGLRTVGAWAYVMADPKRRGGRKIESGRWRRIRRR